MLLEAIKVILDNSNSVNEAEMNPEGRVGVYFEAGEYSGEIYMDKTTADREWPNPEGDQE